MRVLVLSSFPPEFGHFRAGQTVLACLLENFAVYGIDVGVAIASNNKVTAAARDRLSLSKIEILECNDFALSAFDKSPRWLRRARYLASLFTRSEATHQHRFLQPHLAINQIKAFGADVVLLFWDTCFELLLARMVEAGLRPFGYLARPPQAAGLSTLPRISNPVHRAFKSLYLNQAQTSHLRRLSHLRAAANICALDTAWYTARGVKSEYVPNTWPDAYGDEWKSRRAKAQKRRTGLNILANIGGLNATGNLYGMEYLCNQIMPLFRKEPIGDWRINICGRFELPAHLRELLADKRIYLHGFVDEIDEEMAGNHVFLLLNNAGPYTGGYTRVVYAFSSGACLIAHRRLAESMPELVHMENCLLGETPEDIVGCLMEAAKDPNMRMRIGENARKTYEMIYAPQHVVQKLVSMMTDAGSQP